MIANIEINSFIGQTRNLNRAAGQMLTIPPPCLLSLHILFSVGLLFLPQDTVNVLAQAGPRGVEGEENQLVFTHLEHTHVAVHKGFQKGDNLFAEVVRDGPDDDTTILQRLISGLLGELFDFAFICYDVVPPHFLSIFSFVHIGLTQQSTRYSDNASKSGKELAGIAPTVAAETEFVEVGLEFRAAAMAALRLLIALCSHYHFHCPINRAFPKKERIKAECRKPYNKNMFLE